MPIFGRIFDMKAIYARQSKDKKDSISIETQIDYCRREVYDEDYEVYQDCLLYTSDVYKRQRTV